jgi:hypothetical protein
MPPVPAEVAPPLLDTEPPVPVVPVEPPDRAPPEPLLPPEAALVAPPEPVVPPDALFPPDPVFPPDALLLPPDPLFPPEDEPPPHESARTAKLTTRLLPAERPIEESCIRMICSGACKMWTKK